MSFHYKKFCSNIQLKFENFAEKKILQNVSRKQAAKNGRKYDFIGFSANVMQKNGKLPRKNF